MPAPFRRLTLADFVDLLEHFRFTRRIDAVHMHHTWSPSRAQFAGHSSIVAMARFHMRERGFSDIAQHITIDPDGMIWTGRDWNQAPASASGFNGNRRAGPFMFEMVGNFDVGREPFDGAQRATTIDVIARVQQRFGLPPEALRFHREMSTKTCPGSGIDREEVLREVRAAREHIAAEGAGRAAAGVEREAPFDASLLLSREILGRAPDGVERADPPDAELPEEDVSIATVARGNGAVAAVASDAAGGVRGMLPPEVIEELRPHVINLSQGQLRESGGYETTPEDIDAIFGERIPAAIEAARARGETLRLVLYAHGGLVAEGKGLEIARRHIWWWKKNGVYPLYFVWETGFADALRSILRSVRLGTRRAGARDVWDYTTDPIVEAGSRAFGGVHVWGAMKRSAELASHTGGGAHLVAQRLAAVCKDAGDAVELHAVGHSAGSIFHAHFIPTARKLGVTPFASVHFLAPAIRVDTFRQLVEPQLGAGIEHLSIFTMRRGYEKADNCAGVYRKSLLYLIHYALEAKRETPILGLEISLRGDKKLRELLGLNGARSERAEVVWSVTEDANGRDASTATSHGGFDEDRATMNSVVCRILGRETPLVEFQPDGARGADIWAESDEWLAPFDLPAAPTLEAPLSAPAAVLAELPAMTGAAAPVPAPIAAGAGGRRLALCVGIDDYPRAPLAGCVRDSRTWDRDLQRLGFSTMRLENGQATREAILNHLSRLISESRAGDTVVLQFAGHGTQLPDTGADEDDLQDEALCPFDYASGAFVIDDDLRAIFRNIPAGVGVTCFIDCCHSGTITRLLVGVPDADGAGGDRRARFLRADAEMERAHREFRARAGGPAPVRSHGPEAMREVLFSACRPDEVAYEHDGQGDFTRHASSVLAALPPRATNAQVHELVTRAFGARPSQHPTLDCAPAAQHAPFLSLTPGGGGGGAMETAPARDVTAGAAVATPPEYVMRAMLRWHGEHAGGPLDR